MKIKQDALEHLQDLYETISRSGYDPSSQIIGYILTGDPAYITSTENSRNKIQDYEREDYLEALLNFATEGDGEQ